MPVRYVFEAGHAVFPSASFPQLNVTTGGSSRRRVLAFDDTSTEYCLFEGYAGSGWSGSISASVLSFSACATTGSVVWQLQVEAVSPGDALDLRNASSFATAASVKVGVPSASGQLLSASLAPDDGGAAAGDSLRFLLKRLTTSGSDDSAGDHNFYRLVIGDGRS